jgi:hypothetical protein
MWALGQTSGWDTFDCPATTRRWRIDDSGLIEVEGQPYPMRGWPKRVDEWAPIIVDKAAKHGVPAHWVAAIMALESGGKPGQCVKKPVNGPCDTREGIGLMAMLTSTAAMMAERTVSQYELLDDYDLQIDLGAKLIRYLSDKYDGDYVKVAIAYNAGSVRCGSSRTWNLPKEPCPQTPWGVVMGCLRTSRRINDYCAPSTVEEGRFACPVDYPQVAIAYHNAAIGAGWTHQGLTGGTVSVPPTPTPVPLPATVPASLGIAVIGGLLGFAAVQWGLPRLR